MRLIFSGTTVVASAMALHYFHLNRTNQWLEISFFGLTTALVLIFLVILGKNR